MKLAKVALWLIGLGAVGLLSTLDLGGLIDWAENRIFIMPDSVYAIEVDEPWKVSLIATRPDPFGGYDEFAIPADQYTVTMKPLDDHTEKYASFADGTLSCSRRALLHVEFFVELLPDSDFQFISGDDRDKNQCRQFIAVGINPADDWTEIDLSMQPELIQRHISVLARDEYDPVYYTTKYLWHPESVASNREVTVMADGRYFVFDGDQDRELPTPPSDLHHPVCFIDRNQFVTADRKQNFSRSKRTRKVYAFDLTTEKWSKLPAFPEEVVRVETLYQRDGELGAVVIVSSDAADTLSAPTTFVLKDDKWQSDQTSKYNFGSGISFGVKTGVLFVETDHSNVAVKHLENGNLQTIALAKDRSRHAPITVIDDRVLQLRNERVYELNPYLFLDKADLETADDNGESKQ